MDPRIEQREEGVFDKFPRADTHGDGIFRRDSELKVVKQVGVLEETRLLWQNLAKMRTLPTSEKTGCSAAHSETGISDDAPVDVEPVFRNAFIRVLTFEQKLEEGVVVEVSFGKGARWKLCRDPNLHKFMKKVGKIMRYVAYHSNWLQILRRLRHCFWSCGTCKF